MMTLYRADTFYQASRFHINKLLRRSYEYNFNWKTKQWFLTAKRIFNKNNQVDKAFKLTYRYQKWDQHDRAIEEYEYNRDRTLSKMTIYDAEECPKELTTQIICSYKYW